MTEFEPMMPRCDALRLDLSVPARAESSPLLRHALRQFLQRLTLDGERASDVLLAVGEATSNAIEHAYHDNPGSVWLRAIATHELLTVEVTDRGRWRYASSSERGRGLSIMKALIEKVAIERGNGGTSVRFELSITALGQA